MILRRLSVGEPTLFHTGSDGSEIVVGNDQRSGFLGQVGTAAHGDTNMGCFQCRCIIGAITRDG